MPSFSVSQLKGSAKNLKETSSQKLSSTKSKFQSRSSATSTYDPRVPGSKAPPPPPPPPPGRRLLKDGRPHHEEEAEVDDAEQDEPDEHYSAPPPMRPLPTGPPPAIPRHTKPKPEGGENHNGNRPSPNPVLALTGHELAASSSSSLNQIRWSRISQNEKAQLFSWLDDFFGINNASSTSKANGSIPVKDVSDSEQQESLTSHPVPTTYGSQAHDLCMYFSSSTNWDTAWYATPEATPPPLKQSRDCRRSHYIQQRGDKVTLGGGVFFSDMSACWYVVEWSKRNERDTSAGNVRRRATAIGRPDSMSRDELLLARETYGESVAAFAESYEGTGQWCARGECWDLASEALKSFEQWDYIPTPIPSIRFTHGHLIYEGKAWGKGRGSSVGRWRGGDDRIRRGDIVQWKSAKIDLGRGGICTLGDPDHTAVIVKDQVPRVKPSDGVSMVPADLGQLEVVEQSVHTAPTRNVHLLEGMTEGELWIYRPVGMEAYLKLNFGANWPEGMEALVDSEEA